MKRVLLTGGSGFIGANLARRLLSDGHDVHLLLRSGHAPWRIEAIRDRLAVEESDLADPAHLERIVGRIRPDWVFHLAAHGAYSWQTDVDRILRTNLLGTVNLLQACAKTGFEAFVNAGSSSEYGLKDHAPREMDVLEPNSPYAVAKAGATHFCRLLAREKGLRIVTLRLYSVYGPFEEPTRLIPTLIVHGLRGELPPLVDPWVARDFVHVDDVVEAFVRAAAGSGQAVGGDQAERIGQAARSDPAPGAGQAAGSAPARGGDLVGGADQPAGAIYNVGTGVQTTIKEVAEHAQALMPISAPPRWSSMENRSWDTGVWLSDPREIREKLGWTARYSFRDGLRKTIEWLQGDAEILRYYESRILPAR